MTGRAEFVYCPAPVVDDYGHPAVCLQIATVVDRIALLWITLAGATVDTLLVLDCPAGHRPAPLPSGRAVPVE